MTDTNSTDFDYSEFQEGSADHNMVGTITALAQRAADEAAEVARLEAELDKAKSALKRTTETDLPSLMEELGMANFTTSTGLNIAIKEHVQAHIAKARYPDAVKWLDSNGHSALVKRTVTVAFNREQADAAKHLVDAQRVAGFDAKQEFKVEPSTLKKFVREKLEKGEEVPVELFGVHRYKVAELG